eukprot:scaffold492881_cov19-Prasinocladus_malaysianus.AAC.1
MRLELLAHIVRHHTSLFIYVVYRRESSSSIVPCARHSSAGRGQHIRIPPSSIRRSTSSMIYSAVKALSR